MAGAVPTNAGSLAVPGYVVGERLGAGGFGEVFRARHAVIGRVVAIKVLHAKYSADAQAVARFVAEARAVNTVSHPGIVEIFDFGELSDGRQFCVMELIEGTTLRDVLRERTRLPLDEAMPILRGIAEAVDAAHAAGIAHRDLKPDNVFVLPDGSIKLIDFGLAKLTSEQTTVTETGAVFGTPLYMSPEQCRGKGIDTRSDAYSFGALAYHVLVGEPPFSGEALELALHHLNDKPERPSVRCANLDDNVDRALLALLAKDPEERPSPIVIAVDALVGQAKIARARGSRRVWIAAAVALLGIGGGIAVVATRREGAVVSTTDCASSAARLSGVWDAPIRASLTATFGQVTRADAPGTLRFVLAGFDRYAAMWGTQWDQACPSDERTTDPLLHAQRLNCLDNALIDLRGITESVSRLGVGDVGRFIDSWGGNFNFSHASLEDCDRIEVLRAQPPAPPPERRAEAARLLMEMHRARIDLRAALNAGQGEFAERGLARLDELTGQLEAIGSAGAANAAGWRAHYLVDLSTNDPTNRDRARAALERAIRTAQTLRDDRALAQAYVYVARFELGFAHRDRARISDALERAEAAHHRSGRAAMLNPIRPIRARLLASQGELADAVELLAAERREPFTTVYVWRQFASEQELQLLSSLGRHAESIALAQRHLDARRAAFGPNHMNVVEWLSVLAKVYAHAGREQEALESIEAAFEILERLPLSAPRMKHVLTRQMAHAQRIGRTDAFDHALAAFRALPRADGASSEWVELADQAMSTGAIELESFAIAHLTNEPRADEYRSFHFFRIGDFAASRAPALRAVLALPSDDMTDPNSTWVLAVAEAHAGAEARARSLLAARRKYRAMPDPRMQPIILMEDAAILDALGRDTEARATFEEAWTKVGAWTINESNLPLLSMQVGRARVTAGDLADAIEPLEASLAYFLATSLGTDPEIPDTQLALARALWGLDKDRPRARYLAERARDGYARLGKGKDTERAAAVRWLSEHPPPVE